MVNRRKPPSPRDHKPWTVDDDNLLMLMAGSTQPWRIARALMRSEPAVRDRARALREMGHQFDDLSFSPTDGRECPSCGETRWRFRDDGVCECCHRRGILDAYRAEMESYLDAMPEEVRSRTKGTTSVDAKSRKVHPRKPSVVGASARERTRAIDQWQKACEDADIADVSREYDACKSAMKRWRRMVDENNQKGI